MNRVGKDRTDRPESVSESHPEEWWYRDTSIGYFTNASGTFRRNPTRNGIVDVQLANFIARIAYDIVEDDGSGELKRLFLVESFFRGRTKRVLVRASDFAAMSWIPEQLGARYLLFAGAGNRDYFREAIHLLFPEISIRKVFRHTGWRKIGGRWLYLHGAGAIDEHGHVPRLVVELPDALRCFRLPNPPPDRELCESVKDALSVIDVASHSITVPLLGAVFRSVLGASDFSVHLVGHTGALKTAFAVVLQQFFGHGFTERSLPGAWISTANALEVLLSLGKDALLVIDDFVPTGSSQQQQRAIGDVERIIRAQGNGAGRQRLTRDATLKPAASPGGLLLMTGEDVFPTQSARARCLIVEVDQQSIDEMRLSRAQKLGREGKLAGTTASFVKWLAPQIEELKQAMPAKVAKWRAAIASRNQHRKMSTTIAELFFALYTFLRFAEEVGAILPDRSGEILATAWDALCEAGRAQTRFQHSAEPTERFIELLQAALVAGEGHLATPRGSAPSAAGSVGWRNIGKSDRDFQTWGPLGRRIGWIEEDSDDLFLQPDVAYQVAQRMTSGSAGTESLSIGSRTLHKRLHECGLLKTVDDKRETLTVRRTIEGIRRDVLHLRAGALVDLAITSSRAHSSPNQR